MLKHARGIRMLLRGGGSQANSYDDHKEMNIKVWGNKEWQN